MESRHLGGSLGQVTGVPPVAARPTGTTGILPVAIPDGRPVVQWCGGTFVALDAKYSRKPGTDMRSNVSKYAKIRSNDGRRGRQVTRQVWLVYPGGEETSQGVFVDDKAMEFLPSFGPVYADSNDSVEFDELITGDIVIRPNDLDEMHGDLGTEGKGDSRGIVLHKPVLDFVRGTLDYFRKRINEE